MVPWNVTLAEVKGGTDAPAHRGDEVLVAWRPEHAFPLRDESRDAAVEPAAVLASSAS